MLLVASCGSGGGGGSSSGTAPVAVAAPTLSVQPQSVRVNDGQPATFGVTAVSSVAPTYQWSRGGVAIAGANASTYTIATTQLSDDGATFTVVVSNSGGAVQSAAATLNVSAVAPSIANNVPTTVSVTVGQPATFSVIASGSSPLTFQWRRGGVPLARATTATYTIPATVLGDDGAVFDVVVTNVAGTVTSAPFTLVVTPTAQAPGITSQPQAQTVRAGGPATFSVVAAGTAPFSYQWLRDGVAIAGAQASSYTLATTTIGDSGAQYSVTVRNSAGSVTSATALLTVTPQGSISLVAGNIGGAGNIDGNGTAARFSTPSSVALDNAGNAYVADGSAVRKLTAAGVVTTLAGSTIERGSADGSGAAARFQFVAGVAVDGGGNVYVADAGNSNIRRITPAGMVTTVAGTAGTTGAIDGPGASALFNGPSGIATDAAGTLFVADTGNQTIRKIATNGTVSTLAGSPGVEGSTDGTGNAALFRRPAAVALDAAGSIYVADLGNSIVRRISPAGLVVTLAGTAGSAGAVDGTGAAARFNAPFGIGVDDAGNSYVGDAVSGTVRRITPAGVVTTIAGSPSVIGSADGSGAAASFSQYLGVTSNGSGVLTVADRDNFTIRSVSTTGVVTTIAGAPQIQGGADGTRSAATFTLPFGVTVDAGGTLYVSDALGNTIRRIASGGVVTTLAGTADTSGSGDGTGPAARFASPRGLAVDASGVVIVADAVNNTIRRVTQAGVVTTLAGNPLAGGFADGTGSAATFLRPSAIAVDAAGNAFVADSANATIRRVTPAGVVTTFAGTAGRIGSADGTGAAASFNLPSGLTIDGAGNLYVTDTGNSTIRKITPAAVVTTLAGTPGRPGSADGAPATASFNSPIGIAVDRAGNLYVADTGNRTIRKIDGAGTVSTIVGTADGRSGVRLGPLPGALNRPSHVAVDASGNLYITDASGVLTVTFP